MAEDFTHAYTKSYLADMYADRQAVAQTPNQKPKTVDELKAMQVKPDMWRDENGNLKQGPHFTRPSEALSVKSGTGEENIPTVNTFYGRMPIYPHTGNAPKVETFYGTMPIYPD